MAHHMVEASDHHARVMKKERLTPQIERNIPNNMWPVTSSEPSRADVAEPSSRNVSVAVQTSSLPEDGENFCHPITEHVDQSTNTHSGTVLSCTVPRTSDSRHVEVSRNKTSLLLSSQPNIPLPSFHGNLRNISCSVEELQRLSTLEGILLKDLHELDKAAEQLEKQRKSLTQQLTQLHQTRSEWIGKLDERTVRTHHGRQSVPVMPYGIGREAVTAADSLVSSSEEMTSSSNSESNKGIQRQRCTSTSHSDLRPASKSPELKESLGYLEEEQSSEAHRQDANEDFRSENSTPRPTKVNNYLSSSVEDITDSESRVTRRRSKSLSETRDDFVPPIPDTTENNDSVVEELKVEFSVSKNCSLDDGQEIGIQARSEVPQKILSSSQSPKSRNSSGSDHSYSLRSRGPPENNKNLKSRVSVDAKDCLLSEDLINVPASTAAEFDVAEEYPSEVEVEDDDRSSQCLSAASSVESSDSKSVGENQRHKRKRKTRKQSTTVNISTKRRKIGSSSPEKKSMASPPTRRKTTEGEGVVSPSISCGSASGKRHKPLKKSKESYEIVLPPQQKEPILEMKVRWTLYLEKEKKFIDRNFQVTIATAIIQIYSYLHC